VRGYQQSEQAKGERSHGTERRHDGKQRAKQANSNEHSAQSELRRSERTGIADREMRLRRDGVA
jgi:hypothetical protein